VIEAIMNSDVSFGKQRKNWKEDFKVECYLNALESKKTVEVIHVVEKERKYTFAARKILICCETL
jgi:hypothetical protein